MVTSQHRVFFALWPNDEVRERIQQAVAPSLKAPLARQVPRQNWHITLAFIGNVPESTLTCLIEQADKVKLHEFELSLDSFDYWPKPRVVWLGCHIIPPGLSRLVTDLRQYLLHCDFTADDKVYIPHMTLLRNAKKALASPPVVNINWQIDRFALVESMIGQQGSRYQIIKQWACVP